MPKRRSGFVRLAFYFRLERARVTFRNHRNRAIDGLIDHHRRVVEIDLVLPGAAISPAIKVNPHQAVGEGVRLRLETIAAAGLFVGCAPLFGRHGHTTGKQACKAQ